MARIGFVGLGHMGLPMALNVLKAGHEVCAFDLQEAPLQQFVAAGGTRASDLQELATSRDVLITMLQTGQQVQRVCLGEQGLFHHASRGCLMIDCSSIDVASARIIHQQARAAGLLVVDAPVSGGVAGAAAGTLTFMVGGEEEAYQVALPILQAMGQKVIHTGGAGSGDAAKICNNMILGISMIAISEAFVLAEHLGLAKEKLHEVVTNASGQCWAMSKYVPVAGVLDNVPANRDYQPGFAAAMMLKDLQLSQAAAKTEGVATRLAATATELYQAFAEQGHGDLDFSAIIQSIVRN